VRLSQRRDLIWEIGVTYFHRALEYHAPRHDDSHAAPRLFIT
jgi:hypothetical protein